jgi:hypothetical protein
MAYRAFKEKDLKDKFGIQFQTTPFGYLVKSISPTQRLVDTLEDAPLVTLSSEKAVSEGIIAPVLREVKRLNPLLIQIFSGEIIIADIASGLNGEIDFIITKEKNSIEPQSPIICVTEAKIGRLDKAIPQAAAQMLGARVFNKKNGEQLDIIHGLITDGTSWRLLRLEGNTVFKDEKTYFTNDLPHLLGALQTVIDFYHIQTTQV